MRVHAHNGAYIQQLQVYVHVHVCTYRMRFESGQSKKKKLTQSPVAVISLQIGTCIHKECLEHVHMALYQGNNTTMYAHAYTDLTADSDSEKVQHLPRDGGGSCENKSHPPS